MPKPIQPVSLREALARRTNHTIMDLSGRTCIFVENDTDGWLFHIVNNEAKLIRHHDKIMNRFSGEPAKLEIKGAKS